MVDNDTACLMGGRGPVELWLLQGTVCGVSGPRCQCDDHRAWASSVPHPRLRWVVEHAVPSWGCLRGHRSRDAFWGSSHPWSGEWHHTMQYSAIVPMMKFIWQQLKAQLNLKHYIIVQELCESPGGRPGLSLLTSLLVSVDVKIYWTLLRHWSQLVPNMSTDIWGH